MTATVTVREVIRRISVLLNEQSPQYVRWMETELVDWLNDAQMAITSFLPSACSRVDAIKLKPGTRQSIESIAAADCKPGDGSTPTTGTTIAGKQILDFIRNMGTDGASPGRPLRLVSREVLDSQSPGWHAVSGPSVATVCFNPQTPLYFYVYPGVPANTNVWAELAYTAAPLKIPNTGSPGAELYLTSGSNATVISVADEYVDDLVNYVVARANMKDMKEASPAAATTFTALFTNSLNAKVQARTGSNPNLKALPFAVTPLPAAQ